jgi:uncharacterized protein (TIGR02284 family)
MTELSREELLFVLNELIETCMDGRQGFLDAEHLSQNARLKHLCSGVAQQWTEFAAELQNEALRLGVEPDRAGTVAGALHRRWVRVKAALTALDDVAIAAECERGENIALARYQEALDKKLPGPLRDLIAAQRQKIEEALARLRDLTQE